MKGEDKYIVQLDGFRFFAVLFVMIGHWLTYPAFKNFLSFFASSGVNLFFVLSGFLITQILIKSKQKSYLKKRFVLRQFYIRRSLRIFPLYYFVVLLGLLFNVPFARDQFVWLFTYTANILCAISSGYAAYFTHLWSLAVEEQFYLIFPLLILVFPIRKFFKLFVFIIIAAIVSRGVVYFHYQHNPTVTWATYTLTPCCFDAFGIGALLAYIKVFHIERLAKILRYKYLFFASLLLCIFTYSLGDNKKLELFYHLFYRFFFSVFCFWIIGKASFGFKGIVKSVLENKAINYLGKISYGLYVYHHFMPFIYGYFGVNVKAYPLFASAIVYFFSTILLASVSWFLFEKPLNNLKKYFEYEKNVVLNISKTQALN